LSTPLPGRRLRIAVLGDFDGPHTRRWLRVFVERGHDIHAISYYRPKTELSGVRLHVLTGGAAPSAAPGPPGASSLAKWLPPSLLRLIHATRYQRAGLERALGEIQPDVFHAHYAVEHGFYAAFAGFHPYVVSAWGSDIFVEAQKPLGRRIAHHALSRADLVTANDPAMATQIVAMGVPSERVVVIRLGVDPVFLEGSRQEPDAPTIISDRALEPPYNVDTVIRAFARVREHLPAARLLIAHIGRERPWLEALAATLGVGESVRFLGYMTPEALRDALAASHVYVSVPTSDSLSLSTKEGMAAGAFPIVSDLPSQDGWIEHGVTGLRVPAGEVAALAEAFERALRDGELRRKAQELNRAKVEAEGSLEKSMLVMERHYYRLAGLPVEAGP
jgi:glycosyltransferase involved in cell wall biosynthesis